METDKGIDILYADGPCLLVNKPGGLLTQAPPGIDSLEVRLKRYLRSRQPPQSRTYLGIPHRLDRPASGVMAFATTVRATRWITQQFEGRLANKTYWALVEGEVRPDAGTWSDHVRKVPGEARAEVVTAAHRDAKVATLHYRVRGRVSGNTWLEIQLETGRTHQIRIQAASRQFPIVGDQLYGSALSFGPGTTDQRLRWIALHARSLTIRHPVTRDWLTTMAPLPVHWRPCGVEEP